MTIEHRVPGAYQTTDIYTNQGNIVVEQSIYEDCKQTTHNRISLDAEMIKLIVAEHEA